MSETSTLPLKALTIDALWAWAIIAGHKTVENRTWPTHHRGTLVIHAGTNKTRDHEAYAFLAGQGLTPPDRAELSELRGMILGTVEMAGVISFTSRPGDGRFKYFGEPPPCPMKHPRLRVLGDSYAFGPECWLFENPRRLKVGIPAKGLRKLWSVFPRTAEQIRKELKTQ